MFALFFDSYWIFSWLFLDYFDNPFSLISATQNLRADRWSALVFYHYIDKLEVDYWLVWNTMI
jgi:hypothetical protein